LLHDYPIDLVLNLHRSALENQKAELKGRVLGFSVAVMNALDASFGGGKARVLETWLKAMDAAGKDQGGGRPRRTSSLSPGAMAFFKGLPRTRKE
jgi:hypothetical protein